MPGARPPPALDGACVATAAAQEQDCCCKRTAAVFAARAFARRWADEFRPCRCHFFVPFSFIFFPFFFLPPLRGAGLYERVRWLFLRGRRFATAALLLRFTCCLRAAGGRAQATRKAQERGCCCKATAAKKQPANSFIEASAPEGVKKINKNKIKKLQLHGLNSSAHRRANARAANTAAVPLQQQSCPCAAAAATQAPSSAGGGRARGTAKPVHCFKSFLKCLQ